MKNNIKVTRLDQWVIFFINKIKINVYTQKYYIK